MKHRAPVTAGLYLLFKKLVEGVNSSGRSSSSQRTKVMRGVWAGFQTPHPLPASLQGTMNSLDSNSPDDAFPEFLSPVRSTFHGKKLIVVFVFSPSKGPDVMWCETFLFNLHENGRQFVYPHVQMRQQKLKESLCLSWGFQQCQGRSEALPTSSSWVFIWNLNKPKEAKWNIK